MRYCMKCGTRLPYDESARFCPNCGAPLAVQMPYERPRRPGMEPRGGLRVTTLRNRILVMLVAFVFCMAISVAGAASKIGSSDAQNIVGDFNKTEEMLSTIGVQFIFGNNLMYCIMMFVPVLGPYIGTIVLYSTGRVVAALGATSGADPIRLFLTLFIYPHSWLEYVSYSLAISESFWLIYAAVKYRGRGLRNELSTAAEVMAICAVLLLLAAFAEMYIISSAAT
jgi:uncharacterized membrane protein SpoIIM required for sporulation